MKIGIALAGGGVKGAAHIGVLKALEENNIPISVVAGTSIGSIVATFYAMGYTPDEILKLFKYFAKSVLKADPKHLFSNVKTTKNILGEGILSGDAIEEIMQECAKLKGFELVKDIPMPISIPTVDVITQRKYVFTNRELNNTLEIKKNKQNIIKQIKENRGYISAIEIGKAVRASSSYPGVFAPMEYNGYKFVDGGVLNNIPAEELPLLGADKILIVKFPPKSLENPQNALDVLFRCADIIFNDRDLSKIKQSDYIIDVALDSSAMFDINKIDFCYEEGYRITIERMEEIKSILEL